MPCFTWVALSFSWHWYDCNSTLKVYRISHEISSMDLSISDLQNLIKIIINWRIWRASVIYHALLFIVPLLPCFTHKCSVMTSWRGNASCINEHLGSEFTGKFPHKVPVMFSSRCFFVVIMMKMFNKIEWLVNQDAIMLMWYNKKMH